MDQNKKQTLNRHSMPNSKPVSTSWKEGQSGNPNGRPPKDWTMTAMYKQAAEEADATGVPKYKIVARKLLELAQNGDMQAIKELGNRLDGMPQQNLTLSGDESKPLYVELPSRRPLDTTS